MKTMDGVAFPSVTVECVDQIVSTKRKKNKMSLDKEITTEERCEVITDALKVYKLLQEKSVDTSIKVLIEYRKGLLQITEEVNI